MLGVRAVLLLIIAFLASAQAFIVQTASSLVGPRAAAISPFERLGDCPCMRCRTNLKKEKRQRNRVNAFRFKKGGFTRRRFNGPDYAADQKKADEDNKFYSMMFTFTAEEEAAAAEEAKSGNKQAA